MLVDSVGIENVPRSIEDGGRVAVVGEQPQIRSVGHALHNRCASKDLRVDLRDCPYDGRILRRLSGFELTFEPFQLGPVVLQPGIVGGGAG